MRLVKEKPWGNVIFKEDEMVPIQLHDMLFS